MSLHSPIPKHIREELSQDPWMRECIVGVDCEGRIEFDHAFTYAGKRVNDIWAILPLCTKHNHGVTTLVQSARDHYLIQRIKHFNATDDFKKKYPRSTLLKEKAPL